MDRQSGVARVVQAIAFGPFRLLPARRTLFENDRPLRLGGRALDILIALADSAGEIVGKDELAARVWPETFVEEEANLRVHVAALRKALGDGQSGSRYIVTVPGRGYRFVAPVKRHKGGRTAEAHAGLAPVYARFTEGFETNDLRVAKALLDAFAG